MEFEAERGMTWAEWLENDYNTEKSLFTTYYYAMLTDSELLYPSYSMLYENGAILIYETIIPGAVYTVPTNNQKSRKESDTPMPPAYTVTYRWSTTGGPGLPDTIVCPEEVNGATTFHDGGYESGTKLLLSDGYYVFSGWKYYYYGGRESDITDGDHILENLDIYGIWTWYTQTVDEVGDEALANSIIDRSITDIYDMASTKIGSYVFYNCSNLTTVNFPNVTSIGNYAFYRCQNLTTVNFPNVTSIGNYAFYRCQNLTTVNFPNVTYIDPYALHSCLNLTTVNFPNVTFISDYAFYNCLNLTTVNFPNVISIHNQAFAYCSNLTTIDLPNVTSINIMAFDRCSNLTTLILRNTEAVATGGRDMLFNTPIASGTGYIYVPRDLVDSYKAATNWSTYANQIRALEDYTDDGTVTGEFDMTKI